MATISFHLTPVPPFRLDLTVGTLRRKPHNQIDRWEDGTYRRVFTWEDQALEVAVTQTGPPEGPELLVRADAAAPPEELPATLAAILTRMLGLETDLAGFYRFAEIDDRLFSLVKRFIGVKPPRFPTIFEALVNAIACQQLSLTLGIHLLNRLAATYAPSLPGDGKFKSAFPRPADLAPLSADAFRALGFSRSKGLSIIKVAEGLQNGSLQLENLENLGDEAVVQSLTAIRGVGRWSAEYVLLRGFGRWHVFPGDDVGARRRLQNWLNLPEPLDYAGVGRLLARWHPYGGLIYFHFLLSQLAEEGHIS